MTLGILCCIVHDLNINTAGKKTMMEHLILLHMCTVCYLQKELIQWNPGLTICQGSVKVISLNRDIVIAEFLV